MNAPSSLPRTNLLAHQSLLHWYREAESLGEKILCPLLATIPGLHTRNALPCDCPDSRKHFLVLRSHCHQENRCLPKESWDWPNSIVGNELNSYYRRR